MIPQSGSQQETDGMQLKEFNKVLFTRCGRTEGNQPGNVKCPKSVAAREQSYRNPKKAAVAIAKGLLIVSIASRRRTEMDNSMLARNLGE